MASLDKIKGCFLLGACGDALGAPIEGIKSLDRILEKHGKAGLSEMLPFKNAYGSGIDFPAGRITDDTTMEMASVAALLLHDKPAAMTPALRETLWQAYLEWGQHQEDGAVLAAKIDKSIKWPEDAEEFRFYCGAGRGTMAALMQDTPGSIAQPLTYDCLIRGRETKGPNQGCGGMMRVAPFALLDLTPEQVFELGCESAAITHGHADAFVATGAVALLVHFAAKDIDMKEAVEKTIAVLEGYRSRAEYAGGVASSIAALELAQSQAAASPASFTVMDKLPQDLGYDNAFLAIPVLAQTAYALLSAPDFADAKKALVLAVNHSGDSDSVAAIVGNVLGARHGASAVPQEYLDMLLHKDALVKMAEDFSAKFSPKVLRPAAKPGKGAPAI